LTRQVLTQILLERHPDKMELFPTALLHGLLRANDFAAGLWEAYLRQALLALETIQRAIPPLGSPFAWLPNWLSGWPAAPTPAPARETAAPSASAPAAAGGDESLASRLAALEDRIAALESHAPADEGAADLGEPGSVSDADGASQSTGSGALERLERRVSGLEKRSRS
jgi:hypothetical protein